jgi:hypothetical protein
VPRPLCPRLVTCSRDAGNNLVFVSYAAWESREDLWDAAESKAVRRFKEYIQDNHIPVVTKRIFKVPPPCCH